MVFSKEPALERNKGLDLESAQATILVADDPFINTFLRTVLQRYGYKVVTAQPGQGSALIGSGELKANLVITNQPRAFLCHGSVLPLLYIASSPDPELALRFPLCRVLCKPFHNEELLDAVHQLTGGM